MKSHRIRFLALALGAAVLAAAQAYGLDTADHQAPPPWSMADEYWGADEMAAARQAVQADAGGQKNLFLMADRLEGRSDDGKASLLWDLQGWYGGDLNKLWIKTEGDHDFDSGELEDAEVQALWSRAIAPYFDVQAGVRHDAQPGGVTHGVVGVQGLAPYWFEVDAAAFVSDQGDLTARLEAEYELLLTQRLVLQPRAELELAAQRVPERDLGPGFTGLGLGLRLRYEIVPELAPYIGVAWQSALGETAEIARASGTDPRGTAFVAGLRMWF